MAICSKHPKYKAQKPPKAKCEDCVFAYMDKLRRQEVAIAKEIQKYAMQYNEIIKAKVYIR